MAKIEKFFNAVFLWGARAVLAALSVAGMLHILAGVDGYIAYPVTIVVVAFLLRETL